METTHAASGGPYVFLAGLPGSGKGELVTVASRLGYRIVSMRDVVYAEATRKGIPHDESAQFMSLEERKLHGYGIWAERTLPTLTDAPTVIDGIRGIAEFDVFRRALGNRLVVVAVTASFEVRFERTKRRGRADDFSVPDDLRRRDQRELGFGVAEMLKVANYTIANEGTLEDFVAAGERVLRKLLKR